MMLAEKEITTYACFIVFYRNPILYLVSHALFYQKNLKSRQCDRTYLFRPADDLWDFSKADPAGMTAALAQPGFSRLLCALFLALLALTCLLFLINACRILSAIKAHPRQACTLIVLGCKVYGTKASLMLEERMDAAIAYLRANPDSKCIVSGGKGDDEGISEAACMQQYLICHGIPKSRIFMEDRSRTTQENLLFSSAIIKKQGLDPHLALVSNEFHLYRSLCIAKKLGFSAYGIPAKTAWWLFPTYFTREILAIVNEDLGLLRPKSP